MFQIRKYRDGDPISEITALLHRAYKPLADAGWKYVASYQDDARTLRRIQAGTCLLIEHESRIIGTITYYAPDANRNDWPELYREDGFAHFGQFAVDPALQKQGLGSMLMNSVEQLGIDDGFHAIGFDTSEHAADLIRYYEKRGYSFAAYHQWEDTNYRSVIMKKDLCNS